MTDLRCPEDNVHAQILCEREFLSYDRLRDLEDEVSEVESENDQVVLFACDWKVEDRGVVERVLVDELGEVDSCQDGDNLTLWKW